MFLTGDAHVNFMIKWNIPYKASQCRSFSTNPVYAFCDKEIDHTWSVAQTCDGLRKCEYHGTDRFGDPCPKIPKYTHIKYECVPHIGNYQAISCAGETAGQMYAELFCFGICIISVFDPETKMLISIKPWLKNCSRKCQMEWKYSRKVQFG